MIMIKISISSFKILDIILFYEIFKLELIIFFLFQLNYLINFKFNYLLLALYISSLYLLSLKNFFFKI